MVWGKVSCVVLDFPKISLTVWNLGVQKTTLWLRIFMDYAKRVGYAGTWGLGFNAQNTVHVQDLADAIMLVFKAALEGRADEGANGFCKGLVFISEGYV